MTDILVYALLIMAFRLVMYGAQVVDVENRFYYNRRLSNFTSAHPSTIRYQQIVVETRPHNATFEATVIFNPAKKTRQISGEVSRISEYDGESDCVLNEHPELRRFCVCN